MASVWFIGPFVLVLGGLGSFVFFNLERHPLGDLVWELWRFATIPTLVNPVLQSLGTGRIYFILVDVLALAACCSWLGTFHVPAQLMLDLQERQSNHNRKEKT